jgi:hypothetical protein
MSFEMQKLMDFIGSPENMKTYLHNTKTADTVNSIMNDGFWFEDGGLYKTSDAPNPTNMTDMNWWNIQRGQYGLFTVVIQIAKPVMDKYGSYKSSDLLPEMIISKDRFQNDNEDWMYVLPPEYVKGYFDRGANQGYNNSRFNPSYENPELAALNAVRFRE